MESGEIYSHTPAPQPSKSNPPVNKKLWLIGLGAVLAVLAIIGILAPKRQAETESGQATPTPTTTSQNKPSVPTPMPTIDNLPGWQTAVGPNFTLRYPTTFKSSAYQEVGFKGVLLESSTSGNTASGSAQLTLKAISLPNSARSARNYAEDQLKLENLPATVMIKTHFKNFDALEIPLKGEWGRGKIIFFQNDSTVYRLSSVIMAPLNTIASYESQVNQIFSTFVTSSLDPERSK
jgi:hypothetical protein